LIAAIAALSWPFSIALTRTSSAWLVMQYCHLGNNADVGVFSAKTRLRTT
jgi:hypothetical protein